MNYQTLKTDFRSVKNTISRTLQLEKTLGSLFGPVQKTRLERVPVLHNLKVWSPFFDSVKNGNKPFEARRNDRGFKPGDTLLLSEFNPETGTYTGRTLFAAVTYVLEGAQFGIKKGFVIMGLRLIQNEPKA